MRGWRPASRKLGLERVVGDAAGKVAGTPRCGGLLVQLEEQFQEHVMGKKILTKIEPAVMWEKQEREEGRVGGDHVA